MSGGFRQTFPFQEVVYFNLLGHQLNEILDVRQPTQPIATYRYGYDFSINLKFRAVKSSSCMRKEQVNTFAELCMRNPPPRVPSRSLNEVTVSDSEFAMYCCRWRKQSLRGRWRSCRSIRVGLKGGLGLFNGEVFIDSTQILCPSTIVLQRLSSKPIQLANKWKQPTNLKRPPILSLMPKNCYNPLAFSLLTRLSLLQAFTSLYSPEASPLTCHAGIQVHEPGDIQLVKLRLRRTNTSKLCTSFWFSTWLKPDGTDQAKGLPKTHLPHFSSRV